MPARSAKQLRLAYAVAAGTADDAAMPKAVADEMIAATPKKKKRALLKKKPKAEN